jgi:hypothetical protein
VFSVMTAFSDDQLAAYAPNIVVRVATPIPYTSSNVSFSESIPQVVSSILDIATKGTGVIGADQTRDLAKKSFSKNPAKFWIKLYGSSQGRIGSPSPASPASPVSPPPESSSTSVKDLPDNLPFDEILYEIGDLPGLNLPVRPPDAPPEERTPLEISAAETFTNFPGAVYIPATSSCISTPYFSPQAKRHRNGVMGNALNNDQRNTVYLWQEHETRAALLALQPRPDGIVNVVPRSRDALVPTSVYIDPGKWEKKFNIKNGLFLNSFSLILGIVGGPGDDKSQAALWKIILTFGDITFEIVEGRAESELTIRGTETPQRLMLKPSTASYVTDNFGERPYLLTFIPVWNGILISDGTPGSSDWADSVRYIPKNLNLNVNNLITDALTSKLTQAQIDQGKTDLPPQVIVTRNGKRYRTPGIMIDGLRKNKTADIRTGMRLGIEFHRCGAAMKFVPLTFPRYTRYHYVYPGAVDPRDTIPDDSPRRRRRKPRRSAATTETAVPAPKLTDQPNVFKVKTRSNALVLPIFHFSMTDPLDFRENLATIVRNRSKPYSCLSLEFKSVNPDVRKPMQVWGATVYDRFSLTESLNVIPPTNDEGFLTVNDLPEPRILRVSIQRALDGSSGLITWDRNDPVLGILPRPPQRVGAVQIAVQGGANTVPGVIFTGIAVGNSQLDESEDNSINLPLRGREMKLEADGGIVLINPPFLDGFDHRDAMAFLANYAGVPIDTSLADPFRLISSLDIQNPILDFPMGTGVSQAMETITRESGSLYFFDRLGTLIYIDAERSTGRNWVLPDVRIEQFSDEPDFTWVRNEIIIYALVAAFGFSQSGGDISQAPTQVMMVRVPVQTIPPFPWARQAVYTIPQVVRDVNELTRLADRIARGIARPRATARCQVPADARIDLLDLINDRWIITSISHDADTQSKRWNMSLGVELFVIDAGNVGSPEILPLTELG